MSDTPNTNQPGDTSGSGEPPAKKPKPRNRRATNDLPSHFADVAPRQPYGHRSAFDRRRPAKPSANPKRVRGGLSLKRRPDDPPANWISQRFNRLVERAASGGGLVEGKVYAELGQTKRLEVVEGMVTALVQGRAEKPYRVTIGVEPFDRKATGALIEALAEQALFSAKLLSGELPSNIEDICAPLGLKLVPTDPEELFPSCTCADFTGIPIDTGELGPNGEPMYKPVDPPEVAPGTLPGGWCKHLACVMLLLAEKLNAEPLLMFRLRGVGEEELLARIRETRALAGRGTDALPVYRSHPAAADAAPRSGLQERASRFWEGGAGLRSLELPQEGPKVDFPLLRRLGASPFREAKFPLVGLLATCYEVMGEQALTERDASATDDGDELTDSEPAETNDGAVSTADAGESGGSSGAGGTDSNVAEPPTPATPKAAPLATPKARRARPLPKR